MDYIPRIVKWNSLRYDQVFDHNLATKIMAEEFVEFIKANEEVDILDALVDMIYIAIGAMWKMGLDEWQIAAAIEAVCDSNDSKEVNRVAPNVKANIVKGANYFRPEERLQEILDERV